MTPKMILYSLKTQQYFTRSSNLALTVEDEFKNVGRISREARQRQPEQRHRHRADEQRPPRADPQRHQPAGERARAQRR